MHCSFSDQLTLHAFIYLTAMDSVMLCDCFVTIHVDCVQQRFLRQPWKQCSVVDHRQFHLLFILFCVSFPSSKFL